MRSFLGDCNVYRRFLPNFSDIARKLNGILRKYVDVNWENTTDEKRDAFETLKAHLAYPPILGLQKKGCPYMVDTYASQYELREVLLHEQEVRETPPTICSA